MTTTPLLSDDEISAALTSLPEWTRSGDSISRTIKAATFPAGIELVRQVAVAAEAANHHPDIDIRWRNVTFTLSTHSEGGLTALDVALAHEIDRLAAQSE
ncbi:4a-hydroxytetrahydrobiopterin dehydratase [Nocardia cyriacigeorgica]|uniref:4a-hydroxytetrahydrobiopterin dehydratase n=1 Tax=Nocardia cyriacigeorgica TaxID=135487 RepID=UPI000CEB5DC1|nr:4a-hydroxytetrahydrobiopterin dehydratase [Nocardia cyriacigeorgica]AVH22367.1 4a-hydroxytetrahydrobiopterin dehydratase [Nocardia cyriacigeorgica]MBF6086542.1 4a-hydroxytetrahydrobiopterin dehydratase [Nocardia cyriacigeorgica]MBF6091145.1 4a-hydroxytetrahydrobiopterin dehydratase [Nocardia cyriacigeorgica]MBF6097447.1 4a-hydroxytetrahydrobiopterin dehydratase [Nocardia cyriacigeorgica]MBF6321983.1 4a-hydroxytetrahydrobiopterin dehydratase [Nocardia cyriacigeorgica]